MTCRCGCFEAHECLCITREEAAEMTAEQLAEYEDKYKGMLD